MGHAHPLDSCRGRSCRRLVRPIDRCAQQTGGTLEARALAEKMSQALAALARSGDPNHHGLPRWAPFTAKTAATMVDDAVELKDDPDSELRRVVPATTA